MVNTHKPAKRDILEIKNLHAEIGNVKILKGIHLTIHAGEIHAIMGPNGSGKSTLCNVIMGHPSYKITKGQILFNGKNLKTLSVNERANLGLFLAFQNPYEIPGVSFGSFLRTAQNANERARNKKTKPVDPITFSKTLREKIGMLKMDEKFAVRAVNEGFSGGEKKRAEIVQMAILKPKFALLDEIDSGLDIDALKITASGIKSNFKENSSGILLITHYQRILNYITPHFVHIMANGKIVKSGTKSLAQKLEKHGYKEYIKS